MQTLKNESSLGAQAILLVLSSGGSSGRCAGHLLVCTRFAVLPHFPSVIEEGWLRSWIMARTGDRFIVI